MANNYDKIANQYDTLSRLIYGKAQVNAQINQLKYIPENSVILIVGGGTGWILEEIAKVQPSGLKMVYVEISEKMIKLSKARNLQDNSVTFVNIAIEDFNSNLKFDIIITPFLFDNFNSARVKTVFRKLHSLLKENGLWFLVDFSLSDKKGKLWKWLMLKSMYAFFNLLNIVEASKLVDIMPYFLAKEYKIFEERFYYNRFIRASILKKNNRSEP
ncbi:class I SAM-dependent methyltransferase [Pedobacter mendelii]|uniref:Methyltransferase type 12 domain-containing protein n=1 Tax=Pedobacter mendelii TaxID=1908240 RepID=A0ABQ2BDL1_9SPHI|nr:class I SAM-dependent methyltransferase [Pedobacter mendelii]GGI22369.1 hypothetical protein GCM10008119_02300 [Pedobacter mendelii]